VPIVGTLFLLKKRGESMKLIVQPDAQAYLLTKGGVAHIMVEVIEARPG
jgi:hypothetical protein